MTSFNWQTTQYKWPHHLCTIHTFPHILPDCPTMSKESPFLFKPLICAHISLPYMPTSSNLIFEGIVSVYAINKV